MIGSIKTALLISVVAVGLAGCGQAPDSQPDKQTDQHETGEPEKLTGAVIGEKAPKIHLRGTDGEIYNLDDYKGKPVLVKFFAST